MPTSTFYNLPEEKKEKLLDAIKNEFTRVPYSDVSINKIIQAADISRGSFYQYFEDKDDMLSYIMLGYQKAVFDVAKNGLIASKGDLFQMFLDIYHFAIDFVMEESTNSFLKNVFADTRINTGLFTKRSKEEVLNHLTEQFMPYANLNLLDLQEKEDLSNIVELLAATTRDAIAETFIDFDEIERSKADYYVKLKLLKRGLAKKKYHELKGE